MIRIDDSLLEEIGLMALPKEERDKMLRQIYETLEMRVGMRLAERMSDQQLDEFERFIDTSDESGALKWLEANFPDYKQVVATELEKLKNEIKQDSAKIIEAMQGITASPLPQQQAQMDQPGTSAPQGFAPNPPQPQQLQQPVPAQQPQQTQFNAQPFTPATPSQPLQPYSPPAQQPQSVTPATPQNDVPAAQPPQQESYQNIPPPPSFQ